MVYIRTVPHTTNQWNHCSMQSNSLAYTKQYTAMQVEELFVVASWPWLPVVAVGLYFLAGSNTLPSAFLARPLLPGTYFVSRRSHSRKGNFFLACIHKLSSNNKQTTLNTFAHTHARTHSPWAMCLGRTSHSKKLCVKTNVWSIRRYGNWIGKRQVSNEKKSDWPWKSKRPRVRIKCKVSKSWPKYVG